MPTAITSSGITFDDATTQTTSATAAGAIGATQLATDAVTTAKIVNAAITPAKLSQPYTLSTAQASTSGTSIDFTGIPSWARRISVMLVGVSTSGTSNIMVQLGTSSGVTTSGYLGGSAQSNSGIGVSMTTGLGFTEVNAAASVYHGLGHIVNVTGNTWVWASTAGRSDSAVFYQGNGSIALAAALNRVRVTTVNGTDTFDAGTINIAYEG